MWLVYEQGSSSSRGVLIVYGLYGTEEEADVRVKRVKVQEGTDALTLFVPVGVSTAIEVWEW